ncbi:PREDICTED: LOW QUALITY PROTEIN: ubiquitin-protein ligase E3B-like [Branchiostoma belcheri]|uniref:Ubiquitin-protein ligase E3B n=1 Tax=Branchiostoma belcheri TaxID=7741 RepID=A0A6P4YF75_BRABE|nr:PREDICTED: LOW QUALITY PROTEIN: ubiquitin-protein ligase E3B-like [Branchiostoma belcheri]
MFAPYEDKKASFLDEKKSARVNRQEEIRRDHSATKIQAVVRRFLAVSSLRKQTQGDLQSLIGWAREVSPTSSPDKAKFAPAVTVFKATERFLYFFDQKKDHVLFQTLCRYILASMEVEGDSKIWYVSLALSKEHVLPWIQQMKKLLWQCCCYLKTLKPDNNDQSKLVSLYLNMVVIFTDTTTWKVLKIKGSEALRPGMNQLCANLLGHLTSKDLYVILQALLKRGLERSQPTLKRAALAAIVTISMRPLISTQFSQHLLTAFLVHILSLPGLILHLSTIAEQTLLLFRNNNVLEKSIRLLEQEQNIRIVFNSLEGSYSLCLLANMVQLAYLQLDMLPVIMEPFMGVVIMLLARCQSYVQNKQSSLTHWHPVLGWFSQRINPTLNEAMPNVVKQLQLLWARNMVKQLFSEVLRFKPMAGTPTTETPETAPVKKAFKKALQKSSVKLKEMRSSGGRKLDSPEVLSVCHVCVLYQSCLKTLTQLKLDILTGLCLQEDLLSKLWGFIDELGPSGGLKLFLESLTSDTEQSHQLFAVLSLSCDCGSHIVAILDDMEMYEQQKPFKLEELVKISSFLNAFAFRLLWDGIYDGKNRHTSLFQSVHTFLMLLYDRDCRRPFTAPGHWLIRELKPSTLVSELEKGKRRALLLLHMMPHVIPHKDRVILFRRFVTDEKKALGIIENECASPKPTLITVHRSRMVEDGFQQLALLPPQALKGIIRVKFVNDLGLDEAGIDQDGVFKEFLEEIIKRVFDPSLNLFKMTSGEERLYPSPTSYIQEDHLTLFEFVGKMLGKAVYEGIVVEVPFASFFLSQVLSHHHSALYSSIDELPSLDPELYKSLTFIKHYTEGDVRDLELTFSYAEDVMGKVVTHELMPGGRAISVTNDNKIAYVHRVAHFRMHTQIREQTAAFIRGFRSIISPDWLMMFAAPELQKLISGDNTEIDLEDLKKYTQYYGGFHPAHRVVIWLWDILAKDFTNDERKAFLKFVTSCSKPPLLGFAHLEPPFCIRCVEVADDQDTGDTVGSVLRGFFTIRKRDPVNRLPTSSTCFNLLKLPNYQKKSTLKEKLRYAISMNTGFELS